MTLAAIPYHTLPSVQLGPLTIRTFGVLVGIGVLFGGWLAVREVRARGLDGDAFTSLATRAVIVGFIGARLTWVITHWSQIETPLDTIAVWKGGLQFTGGFIAAVAVGAWMSRRVFPARGMEVMDAAALGLAPGLAIGRLGCLAVGEHLGGETTFFLATKYLGGGTVEGPIAIGTTIHNTSLYEALHLGLLTLLLFWLRDRGVRVGTLAATFVLWYAPARFLTDFLRAYDRTAAGLTGAQWAMLPLIPLGAWLLWRTRRGDDAPETVSVRGDLP